MVAYFNINVMIISDCDRKRTNLVSNYQKVEAKYFRSGIFNVGYRLLQEVCIEDSTFYNSKEDLLSSRRMLLQAVDLRSVARERHIVERSAS